MACGITLCLMNNVMNGTPNKYNNTSLAPNPSGLVFKEVKRANEQGFMNGEDITENNGHLSPLQIEEVNDTIESLESGVANTCADTLKKYFSNKVLNDIVTHSMETIKETEVTKQIALEGDNEDVFQVMSHVKLKLPKLSGGLGVRNLRIHNECLLMIWLWRYVEEEHALWREVMHHKYGQDSQWCTNEVTIPYGVSTWKTIRSFWTKLAGTIKLIIGNGAKILFWKDVWVRHEALMQSFPDLCSFCSNPDITPAESWENGWDISFRRHFNE
ncbi:hypothetical protein H5410_015534 [Solanum commersonii]|uniref:Reverse transcriptase zinc-binding domain-containing protein n=1 Tax=Solanum commersonii TaxID=4109 RepID=A0A9J5ZTY6_SOLCO|nr:hypothetical protein H5410_015534 [Solanum commersonii]